MQLAVRTLEYALGHGRVEKVLVDEKVALGLLFLESLLRHLFKFLVKSFAQIHAF